MKTLNNEVNQSSHGILSKISHVWNMILIIFLGLSCALVVAILISVNLEIFMRAFFNIPLAWGVEGSQIGLLFITFLSAAWLLKRNKHISVDLVLFRIGPKSRAILNGITSILGAIIVSPLVWYGITVTIDHYRRGIFRTSSLNIPDVIVLWAIPLGSLLLFVQFVINAYGYFAGSKSQRY